ncbi:MAG: ImmA/IrrE family metallo-endopeptidase [archaeon]
MATIQWTNPSVLKFSKDDEPTTKVINWTRKIILKAIDEGWQGPPFDVFFLANHLGFSVIPKEDIMDARILCNDDEVQIQYNPNRSFTRIRFSVAHEIAHTFFSDFNETLRNRSQTVDRTDNWQLELLCNVAAAEILMPTGPTWIDQENINVTIDEAIEVRNKFKVSMEAALLRLGKLTTKPVTIFSAARVNDEINDDFRIDYVINSPTSDANLKAGMIIPRSSVLSECTAIGYTAKKRERWNRDSPLCDVQCVGIPPYPNKIYPRIIGIVKPKKKVGLESPSILYLFGDATDPRGDGKQIIAHIVNDKSKNWGAGFGRAVSKKWPGAVKNFHKWAKKEKNLELGNSCSYQASDDLYLFHMIAQQGYGRSIRPRIKYEALVLCLEDLAEEALKISASVHMPKIGVGFAGGDWTIIRELIDEKLIKKGVKVTVYKLPNSQNFMKKSSKSITFTNN